MDDSEDGDRMWLVERTFSDDEQNIVILIYATEDGRRYHRRERALTSFTGPTRTTYASVVVDPDDAAPVTDPDRRERYAAEATRMARSNDPEDAV